MDPTPPRAARQPAPAGGVGRVFRYLYRFPLLLLHGGASVVLAETLGSSAGNLCLDTGVQMAVGLEINANHLRAVRQGVVTGTARALHVGRSTQVWEIRIEDERGRAVCVSRLTLAVVPVTPAA